MAAAAFLQGEPRAEWDLSTDGWDLPPARKRPRFDPEPEITAYVPEAAAPPSPRIAEVDTPLADLDAVRTLLGSFSVARRSLWPWSSLALCAQPWKHVESLLYR